MVILTILMAVIKLYSHFRLPTIYRFFIFNAQSWEIAIINTKTNLLKVIYISRNNHAQL